jgi:branched-chain amino acid transport system permease protein
VLKPESLQNCLALLLLVAASIYAVSSGYFGKEILAEIIIFAILAMSLDFLSGYGGMVSLGHAAFYGAGAYVFAVLSVNNGWNVPASMAAAIVFCAVAGALVGAATARVRGIFFIMATLAFGQMAYVYVFENRSLGGDDGMSGIPRLDLSTIGLDMSDATVFDGFLIFIAVVVYLFLNALLKSGFGRTLVGLHRNELRMRALGLSLVRHKAAAFAIAAGIAGLAGTLGAQHLMFVSPDYLHWKLSGLVLVIVILGGLESLVGPVLGAAVVIALKNQISAYTDYWSFFIGIFLIFAVLAGGRGLYGLLVTLNEKGAGNEKTTGKRNQPTGASDA